MVGGSIHEIKIEGRGAGEFCIETPPDLNIATATLNDSTLKIRTRAEGETSVIIKETNGNKTIEIKIEILEVAIQNKSIAVKRGGYTSVYITGKNMGYPLTVVPPSVATGISTELFSPNFMKIYATLDASATANIMVYERMVGAQGRIFVTTY